MLERVLESSFGFGQPAKTLHEFLCAVDVMLSAVVEPFLTFEESKVFVHVMYDV